MGIRRVGTAAAVVIALAWLLTGCTVPVAGNAGVSVTADGRLLGVLAVCHDHIDGVTLYTDDGSEQGRTVGEWVRGEPATGLVTWPLAGSGSGWSVEQPMATALESKRSYSLYGWTRDNSWSTADVTFTLAHLAAMKPGEVRYYAGEGAGVDKDGYRTASLGAFRDEACAGG